MKFTYEDPVIESLYNEGRAIIAAKRAEAEQHQRKADEAADSLFNTARAFAAKCFEPFSEGCVEPKERQDWRDLSKKISFSIRSGNAGRIYVKLCWTYNILADKFSDIGHEDNRNIYYVEHNFQAFEDGGGAWGCSLHTTNSLAEAVALAEVEAEAYRACVEADEQRRAARLKRGQAAKVLTPGEKLLVALEEWHESMSWERGDE